MLWPLEESHDVTLLLSRALQAAEVDAEAFLFFDFIFSTDSCIHGLFWREKYILKIWPNFQRLKGWAIGYGLRFWGMKCVSCLIFFYGTQGFGHGTARREA